MDGFFPKRMALAMVCSAAIAGCSSTHGTYAPDGRRGFVVDCGGFLSNSSACLLKAGRACGNRGYDIIKGNEDDRSILVACKVPAIPSASGTSSAPTH